MVTLIATMVTQAPTRMVNLPPTTMVTLALTSCIAKFIWKKQYLLYPLVYLIEELLFYGPFEFILCMNCFLVCVYIVEVACECHLRSSFERRLDFGMHIIYAVLV